MSVAGEAFVYVTTKGRVSGLLRKIEIWFVLHGGNIYILAEHGRRAKWVTNVIADPRVDIRLAELHFSATARVLDPERDAVLSATVQYLARSKYGWGDGLPVEIRPEQPIPALSE